MDTVTLDDVTTSSAPRGPSVAALALSVAIHGVLLGTFGNEILRTAADQSATATKIINLNLTQTNPGSTANVAAFAPRESERIDRSAKSRSVRERTPQSVTVMAKEQMGQSGPELPLDRIDPADNLTVAKAPPATVPKMTAEIARPMASDIMGQRSTTRGIVRITPAYAPPPRYPPVAERMGLEGRVLLGVTVTYEGIPIEVGILTGSGHSVLDRAALDAVREWRFRVTGMDASDASEVVEVPIRFALQ